LRDMGEEGDQGGKWKLQQKKAQGEKGRKPEIYHNTRGKGLKRTHQNKGRLATGARVPTT